MKKRLLLLPLGALMALSACAVDPAIEAGERRNREIAAGVWRLAELRQICIGDPAQPGRALSPAEATEQQVLVARLQVLAPTVWPNVPLSNPRVAELRQACAGDAGTPGRALTVEEAAELQTILYPPGEAIPAGPLGSGPVAGPIIWDTPSPSGGSVIWNDGPYWDDRYEADRRRWQWEQEQRHREMMWRLERDRREAERRAYAERQRRRELERRLAEERDRDRENAWRQQQREDQAIRDAEAARRQAEEERRRLGEDAARRREEEARRDAEAARRDAEASRRREEQEARRREDAMQRQMEQERRQRDEESRQAAEEARRQAQEMREQQSPPRGGRSRTEQQEMQQQ